MKKFIILQLALILTISVFSQNEAYTYINGERKVNVEVLFPVKPIEHKLDNSFVKQSTASAFVSEFTYFVNIQKGKKINVPKVLEKNLTGVATITKEYKVGKHKIVEFDFKAQGIYSKYKVIYYKSGFVWLSVTGEQLPEYKDVEFFFNSIKLDNLPCSQ